VLAPRAALVVVVWEAGTAFELQELPAATIGIPPAPIDIEAEGLVVVVPSAATASA
jgi:hypothetical protein